jgi:hypothetical protein
LLVVVSKTTCIKKKGWGEGRGREYHLGNTSEEQQQASGEPCEGIASVVTWSNTHKNKPKATKKKQQLTNYKLKLQTLQNKEKNNIHN